MAAVADPGWAGERMGRLARGALAGAVAWIAMDQTLQAIYDRESAVVRSRERRARGGVPALEVLAERLAALKGLPLSPEERAAHGTVLQWVVGIGAGMLYATFREHVPGRGTSRGLVFGVAFWLVVDETLTPMAGLAPGPAAFPWQTHARGFAGHLVFGVAADTTLRAFDRIA